jgi:cell division protein ZapB
MPSSRPDKAGSKKHRTEHEPCDFAQLGLDFSTGSEYSIFPRKETETMNQDLIETLEKKVNSLLEKYSTLKGENIRLTEENQRLQAEREGFKSRVDAILGKLEGI